jgi:hypothetical protein
MNETPKEDYFKSGTKDYLEKYGLQKIHYSLFDKFRFIITAGLGLIAALAWDESLREVFHEIFPDLNKGVSSFMYAILLTILATLVGTILSKIAKQK